MRQREWRTNYRLWAFVSCCLFVALGFADLTGGMAKGEVSFWGVVREWGPGDDVGDHLAALASSPCCCPVPPPWSAGWYRRWRWSSGGPYPRGGPVRQGKGAHRYLRLERRGQDLGMMVSQDGQEWQWVLKEKWFFWPWLPRKVQVGVFAEATAECTFQAVFDRFKLTPLGSKTR